MKKFLLPVLIVAMLMQLFVPLYMIWERYDVLKNGTEVKFDITMYDPYDAFRGRYVSINADVDVFLDGGKYGVLKVDDNGFAEVVSAEKEKPEDGLYITSSNENYFRFPHDRYYMEETLAPKAEKVITDSDSAYITVRIKNGKSVISGLYIDEVSIEEYLTE